MTESCPTPLLLKVLPSPPPSPPNLSFPWALARPIPPLLNCWKYNLKSKPPEYISIFPKTYYNSPCPLKNYRRRILSLIQSPESRDVVCVYHHRSVSLNYCETKQQSLHFLLEKPDKRCRKLHKKAEHQVLILP